VQVSLELNSNHISTAVKTYIAYKASELGRHHDYGHTLQQKVETELIEKVEDINL
jgi:hypothetical protein